MELRHLRYFVAVAEEKSITVAAKRRLRTAQPSLSRQLRELETEVGAKLMIRSARGIELTAAGRPFSITPESRWPRSKRQHQPLGARLTPRNGRWHWVPERLRARWLPGVDARLSRRVAWDRGHHLQQAFAAACRWSSRPESWTQHS